MDERISVTITKSEGDTLDSDQSTFNTTTTVVGNSWSEIDRMLELAGIDRRSGDVRDAQYTVVTDYNNSENPTVEGWLENQFSNGSVNTDACGPEDSIDIDFSTEDELLGESNINHDYGHQESPKIRTNQEISAFDFRGRPESGRGSFRYTPAKMADNPMEMDETIDDIDDGMVSDPISVDVNSICQMINQDRSNGTNVDIRDYLDSLIDDGMTEEEAIQEVVDQYLVLFGEELPVSVSESVRLRESIVYLTNNDTADFIKAVDKVRSNRANSLTESEIAHLAAAFINVMRENDTAKVVRLHECFQAYMGLGIENEYKRYKNKK